MFLSIINCQKWNLHVLIRLLFLGLFVDRPPNLYLLAKNYPTSNFDGKILPTNISLVFLMYCLFYTVKYLTTDQLKLAYGAMTYDLNLSNLRLNFVNYHSLANNPQIPSFNGKILRTISLLIFLRCRLLYNVKCLCDNDI